MIASKTAAGIAVTTLLADAVAVAHGKLDAQGIGWNQLFVPRLPSLYPRIGLGLLIHTPVGLVESEHELSVRLVGPSDTRMLLGFLGDDPTKPVDEIHASFNLEAPFDGSQADELSMPVALNFDRVVLDVEGEHRFVVTIDGEEIAVARFFVSVRPELDGSADAG